MPRTRLQMRLEHESSAGLLAQAEPAASDNVTVRRSRSKRVPSVAARLTVQQSTALAVLHRRSKRTNMTLAAQSPSAFVPADVRALMGDMIVAVESIVMDAHVCSEGRRRSPSPFNGHMELVEESDDDAQPESGCDQCTLPTPYPLPGVPNRGNTCFAAAVVQSLRYVGGFVARLRDTMRRVRLHGAAVARMPHSQWGRDGLGSKRDTLLALELTQSLAVLMADMNDKTRTILAGRPASSGRCADARAVDLFVDALVARSAGFARGEQQDALEALHATLDALVCVERAVDRAQSQSALGTGGRCPRVRRAATMGDGYNGDNMRGAFCLSTKCAQCGNEALGVPQEFTNLFVFLDYAKESTYLPYALPNDRRLQLSGSASGAVVSYTERHWLFSGFDTCELVEPGEEQKENKDAFACATCGEASVFIRGTKLCAVPPTLVFMLNRFQQAGGRLRKITCSTHIPLALRCPHMSCVPADGRTSYELGAKEVESGSSYCPLHSLYYELRAVVVHSGRSLDAGHYYAYVKVEPAVIAALAGHCDGGSVAESLRRYWCAGRPGDKWAGGYGYWFRCDDSRVTHVGDVAELRRLLADDSATPCQLFYERLTL